MMLFPMPQPGIFAGGFLGLHGLKTKLLVFAAERLIFLQQFAAGGDGVTGFIGELIRGVSQAEQGKEQAADAHFETGSRVAGQIQKNQRQQDDRAQGYIM